VAAGRKFDSSLIVASRAVARNDRSPRVVVGADNSVAVAFARNVTRGACDIAQYDGAVNAVACNAWATNHDALDD
jgi:hypothetical protein